MTKKKVKNEFSLLLLLLFCIFLHLPFIDTIRAQGLSVRELRFSEVTDKLWSDLNHGLVQEVRIEFRQGDKLPVHLEIDGALLEMDEMAKGEITVKQSFWIKIQKDQYLLSLDNVHFKPLEKAIGGSLSVGAAFDKSEGGVAKGINILLHHHLKAK